MCGICGYAGFDLDVPLSSMVKTMTHRGPDDQGEWRCREAGVGLGHRRLSIIDLTPAGRQPMANENASLQLVFNGEIYNFKELRRWLEGRGHSFRSRTDTEVLLHLYEEKGDEMVGALNGMFAFALWDANRKRLLIAGDHAGIKPLYYWHNRGRLVFASEVKALFRVPVVARGLNTRALARYLTFLWVPGEETLFEGIHKLDPGCLAVFENGDLTKRRWFEISYEPDISKSESQWVEGVREKVLAATTRQMVSDVPLGAFLSGGVDSSALVACMRRSFPTRDIRCYTVRVSPEGMRRAGFADDLPFARKVADRLGANLCAVDTNPDVIGLLPKLVYHLDEPDADPAVFPAYLISKLAREDGTSVLLSGVGGDELFFGYRSHQAYRMYEHLRFLPRHLSGKGLNGLGWLLEKASGRQHPVARRLRKFTRGWMADGVMRHQELVDWSDPEARADLLGERWSSQSRVDPDIARQFGEFRGSGENNRHSYMLIQTFLGAHNLLYTDKASMAASLEVRVPYLDVDLMREVARAPESVQLTNGTAKYLLKKAFEVDLPREVISRPKTGFGVPLQQWINTELKPVVSELLAPNVIQERGLFDPAAVTEAIHENEEGRRDNAYLIYALVNLELWLRTFIDRPAEQVTL